MNSAEKTEPKLTTVQKLCRRPERPQKKFYPVLGVINTGTGAIYRYGHLPTLDNYDQDLNNYDRND
jgi:hypothetical protein